MTITCARMYAVTTHVISSIVTPIVPDMSGSATLTMLESSTAMIVPVSTVPATIHLCGACRGSSELIQLGALQHRFGGARRATLYESRHHRRRLGDPDR